jgi:hypothetical protein
MGGIILAPQAIYDDNFFIVGSYVDVGFYRHGVTAKNCQQGMSRVIVFILTARFREVVSGKNLTEGKIFYHSAKITISLAVPYLKLF